VAEQTQDKAVFMVPDEQQQQLRDLDLQAGAIKTDLGALELDYLTRKQQLLDAFRRNRTKYNEILKSVAQTAGLLAPASETLRFDPKSMTFARESSTNPS
jgi:hypothetical protein